MGCNINVSHIQLKINLNDELIDIKTKDTQLIKVLNKIRAAKQLEQNLYGIQNFKLIDSKTSVSKIKGQIDALTFGQLLKKYQNVIENGQQKYQQDESIIMLTQKVQQQPQQKEPQAKESQKDQQEKFELIDVDNEQQLEQKQLVDQKSDQYNEIVQLKNKLEREQFKVNKLEEDLKQQLKENSQLKTQISNLNLSEQSIMEQIKHQKLEIQNQKLQIEYEIEFNKRQEQNFQTFNNEYIQFVTKAKDLEFKYKQIIKDNLEEVLVLVTYSMIISDQVDSFIEQFKRLRSENALQSYLEWTKIQEKKQEHYNRQFQQNLNQEKKKLYKLEKLTDLAKKNENIKLKLINAKNTHGSIDICFVMDCTQSMDKHKVNVINCINQAIISIKSSTDKDCNWAAVAYKDIDYLEATGNKFYPQQDFNQDPCCVEKFLQNQKCAGGEDVAEDLQLGLKQAVNLSWKSVFRVIMIITDGPCHGDKYHDISDKYPNRTIEKELDIIIKSKIFLIGIELPSIQNKRIITKIMFQYFKQYFELNSCLERIEIQEYDGEDNMVCKFQSILKQAAESLTQVSDSNTKTKNQKQQFVQVDGNKQLLNSNCDGALQALCKKLPDPGEFDNMPDVKIKQCKFTVYISEFKQVAFENTINSIWELGNNNDDYNIQIEKTQWDCVKTQIYFAEGQIKKIYLIKRLNSEQEIYIIKSPISGQPYQSFDEALRECRSHMIAKLFMTRFKDACLDKREQKKLNIEIPDIQYSDFVILKEGAYQFWIAERFIKGEFIKYNNNNGFINKSKSLINKFLQAFSLFTYFESQSTIMICDIQGVGQYLTDPAINTFIGLFDDTDLGEEGINNYLVKLRGKKYLGYQYMELLDIQLYK